MLLPLLLTTITGIIYQILDLTGKEKNFKWILDWHKGDFGAINGSDQEGMIRIIDWMRVL
ncbi:MAG: hypothetical protein DCF19_22145 [Pseudanabaena frigida]|uniref:Uncharacterized protein n=1 Tax=Pseudanabaena frigida TaxID=945775 RepID=A0A2W4XNL1_9CYAN|nr:MAG: hypothetical protein DCF19_22145 [Pseudanabaena frigida]